MKSQKTTVNSKPSFATSIFLTFNYHGLIIIPPGAIITKGGNSKQSKTGSWATKRAFVDQKKCIKCHNCVLFCPEGCIHIENNGKNVLIKDEYCKACMVCVNECPVHAIGMVSKN